MIISLSSTKGGPGKTTITACLADFFAMEGRRVAVLDTDPNRNLTNWFAKLGEEAFPGIILRTQIDEDRIIDDTEHLASQADLVLIDVAGVASRSLLYSAGISDLVVIPSGTNEDDIVEAASTRDIILNAAKLARRGTIPHQALLSRVDKQTMVFVHSRVQLMKQRLETLKTVMSQRTVYQKARFHGMTPLRFEPKGPAADDIRTLGAEVIALVEEEPVKQQAVG